MDILKWIELHQGMAAWVQAVGSIGAILASVWVVTWQIGKEAMASGAAERQRLRQQIDLIRQLADEAASLVQFLAANTAEETTLRGYFAQAFDIRHFFIVQSALNDIPVWNLPSADLVLPIILLRKSIAIVTGSATELSQRVAEDLTGTVDHVNSEARRTIFEEAGIARHAMDRIEAYADRVAYLS